MVAQYTQGYIQPKGVPPHYRDQVKGPAVGGGVCGRLPAETQVKERQRLSRVQQSHLDDASPQAVGNLLLARGYNQVRPRG